MDPLSKKLLEDLAQMQQYTGRILRSMAFSRMMPIASWQPAVDIYEAPHTIYVYAEIGATLPDSLQVSVEGRQLQISGVRQLPSHEAIACIHQLEIEQGSFQRTVTLPATVDVEGVESHYMNGLLLVTLPKRRLKGKVTIRIVPGEE